MKQEGGAGEQEGGENRDAASDCALGCCGRVAGLSRLQAEFHPSTYFFVLASWPSVWGMKCEEGPVRADRGHPESERERERERKK